MSAPAESPPPDATPAGSAPARSVPLALLLAVLVGLALGGGAGAFAAGPLLAAGIAPAVTANAKAAKSAKAAKGAKAHGGEDDGGDEGHEAAGGEEGDESAEEGHDGDGGESAEGDAAKEGAPPANVYTLDNLVLNPAGSDGTRFLLLTISLQVKDAATLEAMKARDAELRDAVLVTVGNRTVEELAAVGARDSLKIELRAAAKKLFRRNVVKRVYFPQFVIQ